MYDKMKNQLCSILQMLTKAGERKCERECLSLYNARNIPRLKLFTDRS